MLTTNLNLQKILVFAWENYQIMKAGQKHIVCKVNPKGNV